MLYLVWILLAGLALICCHLQCKSSRVRCDKIMDLANNLEELGLPQTRKLLYMIVACDMGGIDRMHSRRHYEPPTVDRTVAPDVDMIEAEQRRLGR